MTTSEQRKSNDSVSKHSSGALVRIWDFWIRTFHWALAASITFLLISGETGFLFFDWHRTVGEFVLLLIAFRILWSFFGSSNSQLVTLITQPRHAFAHLKLLLTGQTPQERGHNAAGGWAVLFMLLLVSFQAISGLFIADEDELIEGAFFGVIDFDLSERLLHLHKQNAELLMILVGVHVVIVFLYLIRARQNLITPMITGRLRWLDDANPPSVRFAANWIGLVLFVACTVLIGWSLGWFRF